MSAISAAESPAQLVREATEDETDFFLRDDHPRPEIVEGLMREGQLIAFAGPYGVGKSPFLTALAFHVIRGIPFVGRKVSQRPVIAFDFETPAAVYRRNSKHLAAGFSVPVLAVSNELDIYLEHDDPNAPGTKKLLSVLGDFGVHSRIELLRTALSRKPNALVLIDPLELLFHVNTGKKQELLRLYEQLRVLLAVYPQAAIGMTFNMRKRDKNNIKAELLTDPRGWLEEVCGTLDILNRSDVRLGMDFYGENSRIINGIRRGEEMQPLMIRPVEIAPDTYAGFELRPPDTATTTLLFTTKQRRYWDALPSEFRFDEVADKVVPRVSLSRLLKRAKLAGLVSEKEGSWRKMPVGSCTEDDSQDTGHRWG